MNIIEIDGKIYIELQMTEFVTVKREVSPEEAGKFLRQMKSVLIKSNPAEA